MCGRPAAELETVLTESKVLTATEGRDFGLVTEVSDFVFDWSQPVVSILNQ